MSDETTTGASPSPIRYKRSAKNYLIDRHFQLKYTGYLVGVTLVVSAGLGFLLFRTSTRVTELSRTVVEESLATVGQGQETVKRGELVLKKNEDIDKVVKMSIACAYKDTPELLPTIEAKMKEDAAGLTAEQKRLQDDAARLAQRSKDLETQAAQIKLGQQNLMFGIVGALLALVLAVGFAGIVITHRVAGPIFKMKRLLRQVGEGKLVLREKLRKGDELQHFFETYEAMVRDLRKHQEAEISVVDQILEKLDKAPVSGRVAGSTAKEFDREGIEMLVQLRKDMQAQLE